ncbi:uncharacterized protein UTRI_10395 [Ustilago trichophora]|uniref:Effector family protein Eff1 n=1 Tax=Ustilago trichophora TaxID=86804 RepID=A0A5C3EA20_9BASI|nr:uncharacterized protein UTRI_10395 [Ustilago trichophora]
MKVFSPSPGRVLTALLVSISMLKSSKAMREFEKAAANNEAASSSSSSNQAPLRHEQGFGSSSSRDPTISRVRKPRPPLLRATDSASFKRIQQIPLFEDGALRWGPYRLDPDLFQLKYHPYDHPALAHFYAPDGSQPSKLPNYLSPKLLDAMPTSYRPEPELLQAIHKSIFDLLRKEGISARQVHPDAKFFYEGMYLFPPLEQAATGHLQMPSRYLEESLHRAPGRRLSPDYVSDPNVFLFKVTPKDVERQIMAISTTKPERWVNPHVKDQTLWLLYEPRSIVTDSDKKKEVKSFLGAAFLPKETEDILENVGDWKRAVK